MDTVVIVGYLSRRFSSHTFEALDSVAGHGIYVVVEVRLLKEKYTLSL